MTPPERPPASSGAPAGGEGPGDLRRSPLHAEHVALGAKLVEFGGWLMPVAYPSGTIAEHRECRSGAVAFDVSHLGTVRVEGARALELLQRELSNDLRKVAPGRAQYSHLLERSDGSVIDDVIVWWVSERRFDVMPNASNTAAVRGALGGADTTSERAVIAVQGPEARRRLEKVSPEAAGVHRFVVASFEWQGVPGLVAGTGYTGEDGVECALPAEAAGTFWEALVAAGVVPAGLGARDTLRLEAGFPLHGHELGPGITPLQAGLGWVVGWDKGQFRGRDALVAERQRGVARHLRGVVADGRQPPRAGASVRVGDRTVGTVTSGNFSPVLGTGIALAFIASGAQVEEGDPVTIELRRHELPAHVSALPFVGAPRRAAGER